MQTRNLIIQQLNQKKDPRNAKWENRAILDTLQEGDSFSVSELLKAVNTKFECEPPMFTYNQLYSHLHGLLMDKIVDVNTITKRFSIKPEYATVTERIQYLPVSNYCVGLFSLSIIGLVAAIVSGTMVDTAALLVVAGGLYLFCQLIGSEFDFEERKGTAVIVTGVKIFHQKIVSYAGQNQN